MDTLAAHNILIVEDQLNWQEVLADVLRAKNYRLEIVSNLAEAKTHLDNQHYSIVVLDMRLVDSHPYGLQGLEILSLAKREHSKVIVLTGFAMPGLQEKAIEMGADYFLQKEPDFDINRFREIIASLTT